MKSIMVSVQPTRVEKIASDERTKIVRNTKPKLETPFKCFIYCTKGIELWGDGNGETWRGIDKDEDLQHVFKLYPTLTQYNSKVIGEFICDGIIKYNYMNSYGKGKTLYFWNISELKIYDKPKELNKFGVYKYEWFEWYGEDQKVFYPLKRPPQSWQYIETQGE